MLQPVVLMAIFSVFLTGVIELPNQSTPYWLFVFAGLVPWTLFSQALSQSANSLVNHTDLIKRAAFPRMVLPVAAAGPYLLDYVIASSVVIVASLLAVGHLSLTVLLLPLIGLLAVACSLSISIGLSALNVKFRDVRYAMPFLVQAMLFATPVVYPAEAAPNVVQELLWLNPMTGIVGLYRWSLLGDLLPSLIEIAGAIFVPLVLMSWGVAYFSHSEPEFADVI